MSDIFHQTGFSVRQNDSNYLLNDKTMILEFVLIDRKIGEILIKTDQVSNKMSRQHYPGSQARSPAFYSSEKLFVKEFPFRQRWLSSCQLFGRHLSVERRSRELITLMWGFLTNKRPFLVWKWPIRGLFWGHVTNQRLTELVMSRSTDDLC